mmetsp:Transcript_2132/g.3335  ORF Transcript_2132/g.3335 Transcript_2132/m.3335 type:complete len:232 (-) Transcript_2132:587-1282(-)
MASGPGEPLAVRRELELQEGGPQPREPQRLEVAAAQRDDLQEARAAGGHQRGRRGEPLLDRALGDQLHADQQLAEVARLAVGVLQRVPLGRRGLGGGRPREVALGHGQPHARHLRVLAHHVAVPDLKDHLRHQLLQLLPGLRVVGQHLRELQHLVEVRVRRGLLDLGLLLGPAEPDLHVGVQQAVGVRAGQAPRLEDVHAQAVGRLALEEGLVALPHVLARVLLPAEAQPH